MTVARASESVLAPAAFLALATPVLGEALPGNTHFLTFIRPPLVLVVLVCIYGLPVLLIREAAVRWKLSLGGILLLGAAYGLYNEGIIAHTLFLQHGVPISSFDDYGYAWGINWSWLPTIVLYHALHSVLYPILIATALFASRSARPWLGRKTAVAFAVVSFAVAPIVLPSSFHRFAARAIPVFMAIGVLVYIARRAGPRERGFLAGAPPRAVWTPAAAGVVYEILFGLSVTLAARRAPVPVYIAALAALVVAAYLVVCRTSGISAPVVLAFGLGGYLVIALENVVRLHAFVDMIAGECAVICGCLLVLRLLRRRLRAAAMPGVVAGRSPLPPPEDAASA